MRLPPRASKVNVCSLVLWIVTQNRLSLGIVNQNSHSLSLLQPTYFSSHTLCMQAHAQARSTNGQPGPFLAGKYWTGGPLFPRSKFFVTGSAANPYLPINTGKQCISPAIICFQHHPFPSPPPPHPAPVLSCMDKLVSLTNRPDSLTGTMGFTIFWPKNTFPFILLAPIDLVMEALSKELSNGMHLTKFSMVKC